MNSKYNYNDAQVPEPKYDTDTANKYYVDKVAKQLSGDIEGDISDIATDIATKSKNYTSAPNPPYNVGDTYMNGDDIYICITSRGYGSFTQADWKLASNYDNTQDVIDGGITTTQGTFIVTDSAGATAAGLTAYGTGNNNVRIWAGSSIGDRNSAPFRVTQGGALYANNATIEGTITSTNANIKGIIKADSGTLGAWTINAYKIYNADAESGNACCIQYPNYEYQSGKFTNWVFAAGATDHTGYGNAKFRVSKAGAMYATSGQIGGLTIKESGLTSTRATFNASEGLLSLFHSSGGSMILSNAARLCATAGVGIYSNSNGNLTAPPKNIDLKACAGAEVYMGCMGTSAGNNEKSSVNCKNGELQLKSTGVIYANGVAIGGSSSRATKKNIVDLTQKQKDEVYELIKNIPTKQYDYKKQYGKPFNYGFIIEDIEDTKLKDLLHITQSNINKDIKTYSTEDLVRLQLITIQKLQNKIEVLENKINEMEGNK